MYTSLSSVCSSSLTFLLQITRHDIATLINQGEINVARTKVEKLVRDDKLSSLLERLQFYCNQLLERVAELGHPMYVYLTPLLFEFLIYQLK